MTTTLTGARILTPEGWLEGHALVLEGGTIAAIVPEGEAVTGEIVRLPGGHLVPGFIDVQVNGGGGVLFNDVPTIEGIAAIGAAHRRFGTTGFLPTLISDTLDQTARAIAAVDAAIAAGVPGVLGIHIEGPFLNPAKRGIHDAGHFRVLDDAAIDLLSSLRRGVTMVTLAPEQAPPGAVAALAARGVVVMAGHTMADYETIAAAADDGLAGATHLFNAMTQLEGRSPGVVGAVIDRGLYAGLIADGHHVHPASMRVALKALGPDRLALVTDAMSVVGTDATGFTLGGRTITVEGGTLRGADGTLAGSNLDMTGAVRGAVAMLGIPLETACRMASATPAALLGQAGRRGRIAPGMAADLVHLDDTVTVKRSWIGGTEA